MGKGRDTRPSPRLLCEGRTAVGQWWRWYPAAAAGWARSMVLASPSGADVVITSRKLGRLRGGGVRSRGHGPPRPRGGLPHRALGRDRRPGGAGLRRFGRSTSWSTNAGMSPLYPDLTSVTEEAVGTKVLGVNLKGPFPASRRWSARGWRTAHMVGASSNVSSTGSLRPARAMACPRRRQGGAEHADRGLRQGVRTVGAGQLLMAGPFLTDIAKAWDPGHPGARHAPPRLGRRASPRDRRRRALTSHRRLLVHDRASCASRRFP